MFEDKNIQDIFEQANLENEDWLEPSDKVLQNIEASIYKKKKNWWFWFLVPVVLVLFGGFLYTYYGSLNKVSNQVASEKTTKTIKENANKTKSPEPFQNQQILNEKQKPIKAKGNKIVNKNKVEEQQDKYPIKEEKATFSNQTKPQNNNSKNGIATAPSNKASLKNKLNSSIGENVTHSSNSNVLSKDKFNARKVDLRFQNGNKLKERIHTFDKQADKSIFEKVIPKTTIPSNPKSIVEKRVVVKDKIMATERLTLKQTFLSNNISSIKPLKSKNDRQSDQNQFVRYQFSSGFSMWKCILNEAYNKALKPADFIYSPGKGFYISAGIQKTINPKITIAGNLQYEYVVLKSAHNSNVLYSKEEENAEMTNNFDIKIASPIGFSNSNISIKRTAIELNQPVNLLIDLENSHQVLNLDFGINLSAQFVEFVKLSGALVFGMGINQMLSVHNQLVSFETNNTQFEPSGNTKLSMQGELNKTRPYVGAGLRLNYKFNSDQVLQFQYHFKQDVLPLYKEGEFKSSLNRQQIEIGCVVKF